MTENKRFYYNTFYHVDDMSRVLEYEIIDRESFPNYPNHNENEDLCNWCIYIGENDSGWQDMLVDLLNDLNDENNELKAFKEKVFERINGEIDSVKESCNVLMTSDEAEAIMDTLIELKNELSGEIDE